MVRIEPHWGDLLGGEFAKPYFAALTEFVRGEYGAHICYPPGGEIFNAFNLCPPDGVRVVILGQDPYHGEGQAEGLCFSVKEGVPPPPSLVNIFKEIKSDTGASPEVITAPDGRQMYSGSLRRWAAQGVFLLNATLTVRSGQAASHQRHGWEEFTDSVISLVSERRDHVVFMLWGGPARTKAKLINSDKHLVLEAAHPSPLAANRGGWFGCRHFSKCNEWLAAHGEEPINW